MKAEVEKMMPEPKTENMPAIEKEADETLAENLQILSDFCARRDIARLDADEMEKEFGIRQADAAVLFGGSILQGAEVLAEIARKNLVRTLIIVGGYGHTSAALLEQISAITGREYATEAEAFNDLLKEKYGIEADFLECRSTNCGNNIAFLLDLLKENQIDADSVILIQDGSMMQRMDATLKKQIENTDYHPIVVNFAAYRPKFIVENDRLAIEEGIWGMWPLEKYTELLFGEMERLMDTPDGYGSRGKGFIVSPDIPDVVLQAYQQAREQLGEITREANPAYQKALD